MTQGLGSTQEEHIADSSAVAASGSRIEYRIARPRADSADWDAPLTVEGVKLQENTAKASRLSASSTRCGKSRSFVRPTISRLRRVISPNPPEGTARCTRNIMPIARDYSRASQSFLFAR